jgi:hypothetical protein
MLANKLNILMFIQIDGGETERRSGKVRDGMSELNRTEPRSIKCNLITRAMKQDSKLEIIHRIMKSSPATKTEKESSGRSRAA